MGKSEQDGRGRTTARDEKAPQTESRLRKRQPNSDLRSGRTEGRHRPVHGGIRTANSGKEKQCSSADNSQDCKCPAELLAKPHFPAPPSSTTFVPDTQVLGLNRPETKLVAPPKPPCEPSARSPDAFPREHRAPYYIVLRFTCISFYDTTEVGESRICHKSRGVEDAVLS